MSINFATLQGLTIPEGVVTQITDASGRVLWAVSGGKVILEVEKITSDTYAAETTYTGEQFILLDIYPKTNGTVSVTYGGLTKTITDTSGATEPNAKQVYFGTFNGASDEVETPTSGELTIEGDCYAFGAGAFEESKILSGHCVCITVIKSFGNTTKIPNYAFSDGSIDNNTKINAVAISNKIVSIGDWAFYDCPLTKVTIPESVAYIGHSAFDCYANLTLRSVEILASTPPEICATTNSYGDLLQRCFAPVDSDYFVIEEIKVPKGCSEAYKTAAGWAEYADYIVEVS